MKWTRGGRSADIVDRRGQGPAGFGGSIGRLPIGRMSIGGVVLMLILAYFVGPDILGGGGGGGQTVPSRPAGQVTAEDEEMVQFVSFVLDDLQSTWQQKLGGRYQKAHLVLFDGATDTACGMGQSAMGPFYCPPDQNVYIDLSFYRDLDRRFGAPGDFAQAYVLAHEIGHHVQHLLGIDDKMRQMQARSPSQGNELSVRLELQADCLAGVWGNSTTQRKLLEAGDVEEGLRAAAAIGDDRLQKQSGGRVSPESFTHGTSAQRSKWLRRGLESGDVNACDTFSTSDL